MITYTYKNGKTKTFKHPNKYARWGAIGMEIEKVEINFDHIAINSKREMENLITILKSIQAGLIK